MPEIWATMQEFHQLMIKKGELFETRRKQQRIWMWNFITQHIMQVYWFKNYCLVSEFLSSWYYVFQVFREDPRVKCHIREMEASVEQGSMTAGQAAETLLQHFVPGTVL